MKDIKDYLHLYLGCDCIVTVKSDGIPYQTDKLTAYILTQLHRWSVKLILRPLSDMTEEEHEAYEMRYMSLEHEREEDHHSICDAEIQAELTRYLLSKDFDLFGLIEAGLAIDKTKASSVEENKK